MPDHPDLKKSTPPCVVACPVHTDTRELAELITKGKYETALDLLLNANPFSSVCGRICHHPCEQQCRRTKVDAPVGLMMLKRFVMESTKEYRTIRRGRIKPVSERQERIAVIGSGPSGMTAAHDLALAGFRVTVFEKAETPGGLLGHAIPRYRLPYKILREDIEDILALGVELKTGIEIGRDKTIDSLFNEGFNAVLIAAGLSESRTLNIPGIDSSGILLALPFLNMVQLPSPPFPGKRVVVIGGGNVAVDAARSARRIGAERVTMISLESADEMPAWDWELKEAEEEGIFRMCSWGPKDVVSEDGKVKGLELKKCLRVFDDTGRFNPLFDESDIAAVPADSIIIAVGQSGNLTCLEGSNISTKPGQRLDCSPERMTTSREGVFACGELITGPASSVASVKTGHRAAKIITHYLDTGEELILPPENFYKLGELPDETAVKVKRIERVHTEIIPPSERLKAFSEIEKGFTEAESRAEARRCLACTTGAFADEEKCSACLTCVRICPFGVATVEKTAIMPEEKCQACGLCAAACPAAAIALKRFGTNKMKEHLDELIPELKAGKVHRPVIVSFCCLYGIKERGSLPEGLKAFRESGVYRLMIPCVARLSAADLLFPFELGIDGVIVIGCKEQTCLYPTAEERLLDRIKKAQGILEEVEVDGSRIKYMRTDREDEISWPLYWEEFKGNLKEINKGKKDDRSRKEKSEGDKRLC